MNQMIGTASTSLASIFGRTINISPPETMVLQVKDAVDRLKINEETLVAVSFRMSIEGFLDTTIMQVMGIETAKEEASLLLRGVLGEAGGALPGVQEAGEAVSDTRGERKITTGVQGAEEAAAGGRKTKKAAVTRKVEEAAASTRVTGEMTAGTEEAGSESAHEYDQVHGDRSKEFSAKQGGIYGKSPQDGGIGANKSRGQAIPHPAMVRMAAEMGQDKLDLILDIPLKVTVVLGRTRRPIKEVLNMTAGSIVELAALVDEPVEVLVNGTLVARGEVVVVDENFGVRITEIISPAERLQKLGK